MIENSRPQGKVHRVELNLRDVNQLFNTIDPSPFREKDLDHDAEEFIVSWTREFPSSEPVVLVVYLSEVPVGKDFEPMMEQSVQNYFAYRARLTRMEFRQLMKDGRRSLLIGGLFLAVCLTASNVLVGRAPGTFLSVARESLTIAGWVAMWRPMGIFLYEWWPLRRRGRIYEKNEPNESGSAKARVIQAAVRWSGNPLDALPKTKVVRDAGLAGNLCTTILDKNSQVCFHNPMIKTTDRKVTRARCYAHSVVWASTKAEGGNNAN